MVLTMHSVHGRHVAVIIIVVNIISACTKPFNNNSSLRTDLHAQTVQSNSNAMAIDFPRNIRQAPLTLGCTNFIDR